MSFAIALLRTTAPLRVLSLVSFAIMACSAPSCSGQAKLQTTPWHDPAAHLVQMVSVDKDVQLEVLDWGGTGRPVVLLTGLGNTAHVFDDFAPKLTGEYHVYGITRRGYGVSSAPASGYEADRLGDDVLAVLDALKIAKPVLAGHSIAGEELSSIAARHPERIAAAVYLDAAYSFAYYDPSLGSLEIDLRDFQRKLHQLSLQPPDPRPLLHELLETDFPLLEKEMRELQRQFESSANSRLPRLEPTTADRANFSAYRSWQERVEGLPFPEAELRQQFEVNPDGSVGGWRVKGWVAHEIVEGQQRYTNLRVPILAIFAVNNGHNAEDHVAAFEKGNPSAVVVRISRAHHYVYLSNEAEVIKVTRDFIDRLP